tara:strand:+ start:858 stop:1772 length:915 start_codon:yes stop_codon:yes gene_type:complete
MSNTITILLIATIACTLMVSYIPDSDAKLQDYIIDIQFLENPISHGKTPVVFGTVVDHAYRPVSNADVKITFASESYILKTDRLGEFGKQLDMSEIKPRTYSVLVSVSSDDGKNGMTRTFLEIDGHTEKDAQFERQIKSMEMANDPSKLRKNSNDPISEILYQHYLKLQDQALQAQYEEKLLMHSQQKINEIRQLVQDKLIQTLDERPLPIRQFDDSSKHQQFLQNLDDDKRHLFELQMNSTKMRFIEAQNIMHILLKNGTSYDSARLSYLEHLSITQEELSNLINNIEKSEISTKVTVNSTKN